MGIPPQGGPPWELLIETIPEDDIGAATANADNDHAFDDLDDASALAVATLVQRPRLTDQFVVGGIALELTVAHLQSHNERHGEPGRHHTATPALRREDIKWMPNISQLEVLVVGERSLAYPVDTAQELLKEFGNPYCEWNR